MTINELIEMLQEIAEEVGGDTEVRIAEQPQWPFEYEITDVVYVDASEANAYSDEDLDDMSIDELVEQGGMEEQLVVYLAAGRQIDYLHPAASRELGWK